jgi:hypothetical protein
VDDPSTQDEWFDLVGETLVYREVPEWGRELSLLELQSGEEARVAEALLAITYNDGDWRFVQELLIEYAANKSRDVRYTALLCFGHLARIHSTLDKDRVIPILKAALTDSDWYIAGVAGDALEDVTMFCSKTW